MPAYQIRVYDTAGNIQVVLSNYRDFTIDHHINGTSALTLNVYELDSAVAAFGLDSIIEVRRSEAVAGLDWYTEFIGFHRTAQRQITETNIRIFTSYTRGVQDLLNRRSIRYYQDSNGSAKGPAPADNIMKLYATENCGSLATLANGRLTNGVFTGFTVAANTSAAAVIDTANAWRNLLTTLQDLGQANKVDFDVVVTSMSPPTFEFRTYYPFRGTDRRVGTPNPLIFAPNFGNISGPSYVLHRTDEVSSVLVLGPGNGPLRDTTLRTSLFTGDSPWNLIEQDQDASTESRLIALQNIGDRVLYEKRPAATMNFKVIQTPASTYGMHYAVGDIVTGQFSNVSVNLKISSVSLNANNNAETLSLTLEEFTG